MTDTSCDAFPTEKSPLLWSRQPQDKAAATIKEDEQQPTSVLPARILTELVGAQHLNLPSSKVESYSVVVQFGSQTLHRTKPLSFVSSSTDPIWSIRERNLVVIPVSEKDLLNNKNLVVTVWGRPKTSKITMKLSHQKGMFLGKVRLKASEIVTFATQNDEQRVVRNLVDELGRCMPTSSNKKNATVAVGAPPPQLVLRFRLASQQDARFVEAWNAATADGIAVCSGHKGVIPRSVLDGTGVVHQEHWPRVDLVTELPENEVTGAQLRTTLANTISPRRRTGSNDSSSPTKERRIRRIKPCPDPDQSSASEKLNSSITKSDFDKIIAQPSRQWIPAGSGSLGRLYVEILSCHGLPNVDYGNAVGNVTDAFCAVCYGDAMVQTCIIDDELSPHWPPWTQRAFVFNIVHPSQVLYLAVFGFKRGLFAQHVPIGRVEINPTVQFQSNNTEYDLYYQLSKSSHVIDRTTAQKGTIRVRLRLEWNNERAALMATLTPYPDIFINVKQKKSFAVARYTCRGEYDNEAKFSLPVLLSYIDELKDWYLRRILYALNDAGQSVFFWRSQSFQLAGGCVIWLPLHSMLLFASGILLVERPDWIPAFACLGVAWILLANLHLRRQAPSPWQRCFSFSHYMQILVFGKASNEYEKVDAGEGWDQQKAKDEALRKRIREDDRFSKQKEVLEKQIEIVERVSVDTKTKAAIVPVELLVELGKIQGIVGSFCRLCRSIDAIITWENELSFWVTAAFLCTGVVFLFVPWAWLLKWTFRFVVLVFLGPQNKLIDIFMPNKSSNKRKLRDLFAERIFRARCRQEDVSKMKAFRRILFGKYATAVPPLSYTLHIDRPLPKSTAHVTEEERPEIPDGTPCIPGQKLYGRMIPRPHDKWLLNQEESKQAKNRLDVVIAKLDGMPTQRMNSLDVLEDDCPGEEGVEVSDYYDLEAGAMENESTPFVRPSRPKQESLYGDWGVEVVDEYDNEAQFVTKSWRGCSTLFSSADLLDLSDSDSDEATGNPDFSNKPIAESVTATTTDIDAVPCMDSDLGISTTNSLSDHGESGQILKGSGADSESPSRNSATTANRIMRGENQPFDSGVEAVDLYEDEAAFIRKSWRSSVSSTASSATDRLHEEETDMQAPESNKESAEKTVMCSSMGEKRHEEAAHVRIKTMPAQPGVSSRELGIEIFEDFDEDFDEEKSYK